MATKLFEQMYANEHNHDGNADILFEEEDEEIDEEAAELLRQIEEK